jgi:hypothetical protein
MVLCIWCMFVATLRYATQVFFCMVFRSAGVSRWGLGIWHLGDFFSDRSMGSNYNNLLQPLGLAMGAEN